VFEGAGDAATQWRLRILGKDWWIYDKETKTRLLQGTFTFANDTIGLAVNTDDEEFTFTYNASQKKIAMKGVDWSYIDLNN
jgi:hypothetical protein